jgi:hypothetical protein
VHDRCEVDEQQWKVRSLVTGLMMVGERLDPAMPNVEASPQPPPMI